MTTDELETKVLEFLESQPDYSGAALRVGCSFRGMWYISYGDDPYIGIFGTGNTPKEAWYSFLMRWELYRGEEWIIRNAN